MRKYLLAGALLALAIATASVAGTGGSAAVTITGNVPAYVVSGAATQVSVQVVATQLLASHSTRVRGIIKNIDAANSMYVGYTSGVTSGNGMLLLTGESMPVGYEATVYAIAGSATLTACVIEEYN